MSLFCLKSSPSCYSIDSFNFHRLIFVFLKSSSIFSQDNSLPVLFHGIAILLASLSVMWSVKSIEVVNSIIVPFFLCLIFISFVWSLTLQYVGRGLAFMFSMDWGKEAIFYRRKDDAIIIPTVTLIASVIGQWVAISPFTFPLVQRYTKDQSFKFKKWKWCNSFSKRATYSVFTSNPFIPNSNQ